MLGCTLDHLAMFIVLLYFQIWIEAEFLFNWSFIIYQHDWSWNVGMFKTVSKQEISPQRCKNKPMRKEGLYLDVSSFVIANSLITLIVLDLLEIYEWKKKSLLKQVFLVPKGNIVIGHWSGGVCTYAGICMM